MRMRTAALPGACQLRLLRCDLLRVFAQRRKVRIFEASMGIVALLKRRLGPFSSDLLRILPQRCKVRVAVRWSPARINEVRLVGSGMGWWREPQQEQTGYPRQND